MGDRSVIVDAISKSFGDVEAVRDITFEVRRGEVVGLLGPNGAGKTTTVDILSTLTRPDRGRAMVAGPDALSDGIIVIDHGLITAEGPADDLRDRTGGSLCDWVPRDARALRKMAEALGPLLTDENRAPLTDASDRISFPAPSGPATL